MQMNTGPVELAEAAGRANGSAYKQQWPELVSGGSVVQVSQQGSSIAALKVPVPATTGQAAEKASHLCSSRDPSCAVAEVWRAMTSATCAQAGDSQRAYGRTSGRGCRAEDHVNLKKLEVNEYDIGMSTNWQSTSTVRKGIGGAVLVAGRLLVGVSTAVDPTEFELQMVGGKDLARMLGLVGLGAASILVFQVPQAAADAKLQDQLKRRKSMCVATLS